MKILILGGTVFIGRHLVQTSVSRGHQVTLFNRGQTNPDLFPTVDRLHGDRDGNLNSLQGRRWDAVIDLSTYVPRIARASALLLADSVDHYTFISSLAVYAEFTKPGIKEDCPVGTLVDETVEEKTPQTFGPLKALCERVVDAAMPGRVLNVRPGLVVGPFDPTDRFTYWPHRIAQGGEVLAPGRPDRQIQIIDVQDLAEWIVKMVEMGRTGIYNAVGPDDVLRMQGLLEECKAVISKEMSFTWVSEEFLLKEGVVPYTEMTLWLPRTDETVNCRKAISAGLSFRPLVETIQRTLAWDATRPPDVERIRGLKPHREAQLLARWRETRPKGSDATGEDDHNFQPRHIAK
jgi:2'-hydroxyisoflavone reductase